MSRRIRKLATLTVAALALALAVSRAAPAHAKYSTLRLSCPTTAWTP